LSSVVITAYFFHFISSHQGGLFVHEGIESLPLAAFVTIATMLDAEDGIVPARPAMAVS
jgi:hypothetical protein